MATKYITSSYIHGLYTKIQRDEYIFELNDYPGIQIIRKYESSLKDMLEKRMFIHFHLREENNEWHVEGGIDVVKNKTNEKDNGWTMEFPKGVLSQKPTNYFFGKSENILLDTNGDKVVFKNTKYSLNDFIDLLEKNHLRDMFLLSRFTNLTKFGFLHILFRLCDSRYKKLNYIFNRKEHQTNLQQEVIEAPSKQSDPFFKYFFIYKNMIGTAIILSLTPLFYLSICLPSSYFTISNPFLLFSVLLYLFFLEKLSNFLFNLLTGTDFVQKITRSAVELKGNLKKF